MQWATYTHARGLTYKSSSVHRIDSPRWQHSFFKELDQKWNEIFDWIDFIKTKGCRTTKKDFFGGSHRWTSLLLNRVITARNKKNRNWFRFFCFSVSAEKSREIYPPGILGHKSKLITAVKKSFPVKPKFPDPSSLFIRSFSRVALQSMQRTFSPKVKHPCLS